MDIEVCRLPRRVGASQPRCDAETVVLDVYVRVSVCACSITAEPILRLSPAISLAALLSPSLPSRFAYILHFCKLTAKIGH